MTEKPLTEKERAALTYLFNCKDFAWKADMGVLAALMGAATREDYGTQKGRLLRLGLAEYRIRDGRFVDYKITNEGKKAL